MTKFPTNRSIKYRLKQSYKLAVSVKLNKLKLAMGISALTKCTTPPSCDLLRTTRQELQEVASVALHSYTRSSQPNSLYLEAVKELQSTNKFQALIFKTQKYSYKK